MMNWRIPYAALALKVDTPLYFGHSFPFAPLQSPPVYLGTKSILEILECIKWEEQAW
jgi:hypothetical protein